MSTELRTTVLDIIRRVYLLHDVEGPGSVDRSCFVTLDSTIQTVFGNLRRYYGKNVRLSEDYNYSACSTILVIVRGNIEDLESNSGESGDEIRQFKVLISRLGPFAYIKYYRGVFDRNEWGNLRWSLELCASDAGALLEDPKNGKAIVDILTNAGLKLLSDDIVNEVVPGGRLELDEEPPTIYKLLFSEVE